MNEKKCIVLTFVTVYLVNKYGRDAGRTEFKN